MGQDGQGDTVIAKLLAVTVLHKDFGFKTREDRKPFYRESNKRQVKCVSLAIGTSVVGNCSVAVASLTTTTQPLP